jgi:hexaprenyl-diphosphate synthase
LQTLRNKQLTYNIQARTLVIESDGIEQTRAFAQLHVDRAAQAIASFPESEAKNGLLEMCTKVMERRK